MLGSDDDDTFFDNLDAVLDEHIGLSPDSSLAYPGDTSEDVLSSGEESLEEATDSDTRVAESHSERGSVGVLSERGIVESCSCGGLIDIGPSASALASENVLELTSCLGSSQANEKQSLNELIELASSSDISSGDRNALSALILNHPEVTTHPEMLPLYPTYNDGMRAFDSPGVWLYSKKPSAPLKMKTKDGRLVEWDPDFKLGLIVTFWNDNSCGANGAPAENKYALKLHFGGSKHLIDGSNVICQHSEKSRTDVRFKARCYLRVCVPKSVADLSSPAKKIQEITRGESDLQVASPSRLQKHENSVGDVQSNVLSSRSAGESAAQDIIGLLPMTEIQRRLHRHDRGAKKEFLRHLSYFITNALSQNEESSDEECDRSLGQGEDDEITANPHHKRARNKGTGGVRNLSGAHEALLLRCLQLASEFEDDISDNESKRDFKCVNDEIERIRSTHDSRTDDAFEVASSIQIQPSEHLYGGMEPEVRLEEANLKLYDDYDFCVSKMRSLHVEEDDGTSVTIDSQSWEEFKERFAAAKIDIGETGKPKISSLESNLANKQGSTALLIAFVDKVKETVKSINIVDKSPAVIQGKAADAAVSNPFSKVTNEVQKGLKDTSDNIAWGSAQAQYNIASIAGKAGPPIKPYLSLKEEQKARMTALFKAVDPNKLEIIDKLVEKRGQLKGVIGFRKDGFDQMWKSYKQRWGAEAIKKAFDKVEEKKKMFYRLKTLALFAAADLPMDGPEIDVLMEKYSGKYDDMYKFWVTTKKFDAYAIAAAHANALKNIER